MSGNSRSLALVTIVVAVCTAACTAGGPILANPTAAIPAPAASAPASPRPPDPQPIVFPRDDGPHDRLTEWWYYTGHLRDRATGDRYGFEFVMFRAERGAFPVTWASHLAITDEAHDRFAYSQRNEVGPQVDLGSTAGFSLAIGGAAQSAAPGSTSVPPTSAPPSAVPASAVAPTASGGPPWTMAGSNGIDSLSAALSPAEAATAGVAGGLGLNLALRATKPPALHGMDGYVDFGPAGGSYYYSRTRMDASGTIVVDGRSLAVDGIAWFDHQWGDFIAVGGGGWDWFAIDLDDGTDITLSLVRDASGGYPLVYGTMIRSDGTTLDLAPNAFIVTPTASWTSPATGATYPAAWHVIVYSVHLEIDLRPTVADQELDTRATTGVVYWEGSQVVRATRDGAPVGGQAYVELTGYAEGAVESPNPSASPATSTPEPTPGRSTSPIASASPSSSPSPAASPAPSGASSAP
jgi:predicted secreted hydrolase